MPRNQDHQTRACPTRNENPSLLMQIAPSGHPSCPASFSIPMWAHLVFPNRYRGILDCVTVRIGNAVSSFPPTPETEYTSNRMEYKITTKNRDTLQFTTTLEFAGMFPSVRRLMGKIGINALKENLKAGPIYQVLNDRWRISLEIVQIMLNYC